MKTRKSVKTKDSMCPSQKDVRFLESQLLKEVQTHVFVYLIWLFRCLLCETWNLKRETWAGTNLDYEWSPFFQPRPQGFCLKKWPHPFFEGKALGTRLPFFLRDTKADQRRARRKIPTREKGEMWRSSRLAFLAWGVPSRSRFARPTIPEEKWGLLDV